MILPLRKETYVTSIKSDNLIEIISGATGKNRSDISDNGDMLFLGNVKENSFQITRRLDRPENFIPQINGDIESSSTGSIMFLRYTLQFSSKMFVVFWTVTTLMFALFLWFIQTNMKLGLVSLGALVFNILVTHVNFDRQFKKSRKVLMDLLEEHQN